MCFGLGDLVMASSSQGVVYVCVCAHLCVYRLKEWAWVMVIFWCAPLFNSFSYTSLACNRVEAHGAGRNSQGAWASQSYLLQILRALVSTEITGCSSGNDLKRIWKVTLMLHLQFMTFWGKKLHLTSWNSRKAIVCESGGSIFIPQSEQSDCHHLHS